jgi:hypothetical protein
MPAGNLRWCHANANRCWRWASEATSPEHRKFFLDTARAWSELVHGEQRRRSAQAGTPSEPPASNQLRSPELSDINLIVEAA